MSGVPQWSVWLVTAVLVEAAIIDGLKLKVPNWLTFHFAAGGLAVAAVRGGGPALLWSVEGLLLGLALLLPLYAIGGMGSGDVKLLAGVGAWMGPELLAWAFVVSVLVGGLMGVVLIARTGGLARHLVMFKTIIHEIVTVRDPVRLSELAAARKPTMTLLPYGIPIAVGSIAYFAWMGILR
jgi:prepilin peptidase CpaA